MKTTVVSMGMVLAIAVHANADHARRRHRGADPEQLLKSNGTSVANGCGPEATEIASWWRFADSHTYEEGNGRCEQWAGEAGTCDGVRRAFVVNFRDACNLHDVGYEGRFYVRSDGRLVEQTLVYDKILGVDVDYSTMSREQVDAHFLDDMRAECEQQIQLPRDGDSKIAYREWNDALESCRESGHGPAIGGSWGAVTLWKAVRSFAETSFHTLNHQRKNDGTCSDSDQYERGCPAIDDN